MIKNKIVPFNQVSLKHLFFKNEKMKDIQIIPTHRTRQLMKKMGIFFKANDTSLLLGYSGKTLMYLKDLPGKSKFAFTINNNNPYFQNITKLPAYIPNDKLLYFDNLNTQSNGKETILLHKSDFVEAENLIHLKKSKFEFSLNNSLGIIHLYFDFKMLKEQEDKNNIKWNYEIRFANRSTFWRYYFIKSRFQKPPTFKISHPKNGIKFLPAQIKKLTNGTLAWEVTSQESIPLRENYQDHFNATFKTSRESKREVTITLPNADYQKTRREVGEMDMEKKSGSNIIVKTVKMYSDIYVHI